MPEFLRARAARYRRMMSDFSDLQVRSALEASAIELEREALEIEAAAGRTVASCCAGFGGSN
ncbi:MAG: hypothetical protein J0H67_08465 [Rhodospirillales bacterium]|nr:hypothetical protein [Rhodospirillales bacterium]